jgi:hypothetical protein
VQIAAATAQQCKVIAITMILRVAVQPTLDVPVFAARAEHPNCSNHVSTGHTADFFDVHYSMSVAPVTMTLRMSYRKICLKVPTADFVLNIARLRAALHREQQHSLKCCSFIASAKVYTVNCYILQHARLTT